MRLDDVRRFFGDTPAVDGVSLNVESGCTVALIGPSGCGKTTILRMIAGLLPPSSGTIEVDGRPLSPATVGAIRERLGYVIQSGGLFPHLTVRGNLALSARERGWTPDRVDRRIDELFALTRLDATLAGRYPAELSGGQRQRVALMRALMLDPALLLMDEPLGALDPMIRRELQEELKAIFARLAKTVVFVTHDVFEADHFADRVHLLDRGRCVASGTVADFLASDPRSFAHRFVNAQRRELRDAERA